MNEEEKKEKLKEALLKCATGFTAVDIVEEFNIDKAGERLVKCKKTYRDIAPDLSALKILLDEVKGDAEEMTEEQLVKERDRLLNALLSKQKNPD